MRSVTATKQAGPHAAKFLTDFHKQTKREHALLGSHSDEEEGGVEIARWISIKAGLMLLLGVVIAAAFADPLVDAVENFSAATSIPSFFISFMALPFATNSNEAVLALIFTSRKKQKTASLTFSEKRLEDDAPVPSGTYLDESNEKKIDSVPEFCIYAGSVGNFARFINHSCDPNLFVQCVLSSHHDIQLARVMLFAAENMSSGI